jgi:hypothetical protein
MSPKKRAKPGTRWQAPYSHNLPTVKGVRIKIVLLLRSFRPTIDVFPHSRPVIVRDRTERWWLVNEGNAEYTSFEQTLCAMLAKLPVVSDRFRSLSLLSVLDPITKSVWEVINTIIEMPDIRLHPSITDERTR